MTRFAFALALAAFSIEAASQTSPEAKPARESCNAKPATTANCTPCVRPPYPAESRRKGEQGEVRLKVAVSAAGTVQDVQIVRSSGYPTLDEIAVDAAKQECYRAAKDQHGKPMDGVMTIIYNWKLKDPVQ